MHVNHTTIRWHVPAVCTVGGATRTHPQQTVLPYNVSMLSAPSRLLVCNLYICKLNPLWWILPYNLIFQAHSHLHTKTYFAFGLFNLKVKGEGGCSQ